MFDNILKSDTLDLQYLSLLQTVFRVQRIVENCRCIDVTVILASARRRGNRFHSFYRLKRSQNIL
jgi:hypothetical protein